jgi:hypothetical protein
MTTTKTEKSLKKELKTLPLELRTIGAFHEYILGGGEITEVIFLETQMIGLMTRAAAQALAGLKL